MAPLEFAKHLERLNELLMAINYTLGGIERQDRRCDEDAEVRKTFEQYKESLNSASELTGASAADIAQGLKDMIAPKSAGPIVLSFGLVALCTELEVFIAHLIDVILQKDPRQLKHLASQINVTATEVLESVTYEEVLATFRYKVAKKCIDSNARAMIVTHLGKNFGLFREEECRLNENAVNDYWKSRGTKRATLISTVWGIPELETAVSQRHQVVHEGQLPISDPAVFTKVHLAGVYCKVGN